MSLTTSPVMITARSMLEKIFKSKVPLEILYRILDAYCVKKSNHYVIDETFYRQMRYHVDIYQEWIKEIRNYYHESKRFYAEREISYNNLVTMIRQVCKTHQIVFKKEKCYRNCTCENAYELYYS